MRDCLFEVFVVDLRWIMSSNNYPPELAVRLAVGTKAQILLRLCRGAINAIVHHVRRGVKKCEECLDGNVKVKAADMALLSYFVRIYIQHFVSYESCLCCSPCLLSGRSRFLIVLARISPLLSPSSIVEHHSPVATGNTNNRSTVAMD